MCQISSYLTTQTEWISTPCSMSSPNYINGQIYAVCKDYYRWYRVPGGSDSEHNTPVDFVALNSPGELPPGAVFGFAGSNNGDYAWAWYYQYQGSFIEKIILHRDNSCGLNFEELVDECTTEYLEVCDSTWQNCIKIVENGQETGLLPETAYITDERVCRNFAGTLENYVICLNVDNVKIDNGTGFHVATNPATRVNGSCVEVDVLTITYFYLYGSPSITNTGYIWNGKVQFACGGGEESSECQVLINQGCVYHSHECLDSDCNQIKYIYNCGGTGQITGYNVQYVCSDGIRCMGSECHDTSYEANTDFIQAATAFTILNMYRVDSDSIYIFPGGDSRCQSKPKNCCKNPGVGISIGDYIRAGLAAVNAYKLLSGGLSATWASYASAFTHILGGGNVFMGLGDLFGVYNSLNSTIVTSSVQALSASGMSAANALGATVEIAPSGTYFVHIEAGLIQNLATVTTVVTVALTVYTVVKFVYDFVFQCTQEDITTSYKVGLHLCHYVGEYCASKVLGFCLKKKKTYCCFNSILARLVQECVRPQVGRNWGDARDPDCGGLLPGELSSADLSKCDFTEYMQHVQFKTQLTEQDIENIQNRVESKVNSP